jgi:PHD/YefM family antitoxin component YafN of YafNO toxin-antitoxin module
MRTVTKAEAEQNLAAVLDAAAKEPVRIQQAGQDMIVVSASEFEEARRLLRKERVRQLQEVMRQASAQAAANGFTEEMLPELLKDE